MREPNYFEHAGPSVLGQELTGIFDVEDWQVLNGLVRFRGRLLVEPGAALALLSPRVAPYGYVPMIWSPQEIALVRLGVKPRSRPAAAWKGWPLNLALFAATVLTTLFVGALMEGADPLGQPAALLRGLPFSISLLLILGVHELGHYLTARAYGVSVSLPYFVPLPIPPMGTMGAIIRMRSPIPNRRVLFDIGVTGPLAGLFLAVPIAIIGLRLSQVTMVTPSHGEGVTIVFGSSLAFRLLERLVVGSLPAGHDILLHPIALAGWLGMFVTALNLMPLSQLDGGHIAYAALGRHHRAVVYCFLGVMVVLFLTSGWYGWLIWIGVAIALGLRHPPPMDNLTPLDRRRWVLAAVALVLLIMLTTPLPLYEF
jgi:membrane-associated protease RseP (regulator of RpoE activity)